MQAWLPDWLPALARAFSRETQSPLFDPWLLARWLAQNLALSSLILLADLVAGSAVIRLLERRTRRALPAALRAATAVALGSGLAGLALFWLGMAGWLTPRAPLVVTAGFGLAGAAVLHRLDGWRRTFAFLDAFAVPRKHRPAALLFALLLAVPGLFLLADLVMPVMEFDSTMYHMMSARVYRETQSVPYQGALRYNALPHLSVLLLVRHWSILGDDALAKLVNLEYVLMLLLALVYAAREFGWKAGWIPGVLFVLTSPLLFFVARFEYSDLPLAAYTTVAGCLLFHQVRRRTTVGVAAGLVLGFAASIKLQGHVLAACLLFGFAAASLKWDRPPDLSRNFLVAARTLVVAGLLAALVCGGWWLRSWVSTGSPAYPFFIQDHPDAAGMLRNDSNYGRGHGPAAFLLIPWHMIVGPPKAFADPFVFGPAGLLLAAAAVVAGVRIRKAPPPEIVFLVSTLAVYLLFWFFTSQVMRYLVSLLPLAGVLFLWLLARSGIPRRVPLFVALLLAIFPLVNTGLTSTVFRYGVLPGVTHAGKQQALAAAEPAYPVLRELNRHAGGQDRTYLLFCENCKYHTLSRTWGDWYGDRSYFWLEQGTRSASDVVGKLKAAGFRWVVVNRGRARAGASIFRWDFSQSAFVQPDRELSGARTLYSDRNFAVFQLW